MIRSSPLRFVANAAEPSCLSAWRPVLEVRSEPHGILQHLQPPFAVASNYTLQSKLVPEFPRSSLASSSSSSPSSSSFCYDSNSDSDSIAASEAMFLVFRSYRFQTGQLEWPSPANQLYQSTCITQGGKLKQGGGWE